MIESGSCNIERRLDLLTGGHHIGSFKTRTVRKLSVPALKLLALSTKQTGGFARQ